MVLDIFLIIILLTGAALFASSEAAFINASKVRLELKARKNDKASQNALFFINNPVDFYYLVIFGNIIFKISFIFCTSSFLLNYFSFSIPVTILFSVIIIVLAAEIIPKFIAKNSADRVILISSIPLKVSYYLFYPFIKLISSLKEKEISINEEKRHINSMFNEEELDELFEEIKDDSGKKEINIIDRMIALGEQKVYEAMRPRTEIVGVESDATINEVISVFIDSGYSKILVYEESLDNIKGVVYAYDLFKSPKNLNEILREVVFVPDTKKSLEMLNEFLRKRTFLAVVIDEFGGTAGIITMEDIIEELFGEIRDEFDVEEDILRKIDETSYLISGKVEIDFINEKYDLKIPPGDYETIGGYIINKLGKIPLPGETVKIDDYTIQIIRATPIKIEVIKLIISVPAQ